MISFGFMMVCANAFFMKSIKSSTPTIGVCITQFLYVGSLYAIECILDKMVIATIFNIVKLFLNPYLSLLFLDP